MPILYIRDKDGVFKAIRALKGNDGKSAYEQAKEGGYTGTEESFIALLNGLATDTETGELLLKLEEHTTDITQHIVTNANGGISVAGGNVSDKSIAIGGGCTASGAGVALGDYADSKGGGAVGPDAKTKLGGSVGQVAISDSGFAGGEFATTNNGGAVGQYAFAGNGFAGGKSAWAKSENHELIDAIQLGEGWNTAEKTLQVYDYQLMDANGLIPPERLPIATGSYVGTGTYGENNKTLIPLPFKPKLMIIGSPSYDGCPDVLMQHCFTGAKVEVSAIRPNGYSVNAQYENGILSLWHANNDGAQCNFSGWKYYWYIFA